MPLNARADRTGGDALVLYQQFKFAKKKNVIVKAEVEGEFEPVPFLMEVSGQIYSPSTLTPGQEPPYVLNK